MHYAVPRLLHTAGCLDRLYTDFAAPRAMRVLRPLGRRFHLVGRALGRAPQGIPADRISHFPALAFSTMLATRMARSNSEYLRHWLLTGEEFCRTILQNGWGGAGAVYAFSTAALPLLEAARQKGMLAIVEQPGAPRAIFHRLLSEEAAAWPGWAFERVSPALCQEIDRLERAEWAAADLVLCGSEFVRHSIRELGGPVERCAVIPYGVDLPPMPRRRRRSGDPLHVLFCGRVGLMKGIPYLLRSAHILSPARFHFRLVGRSELPKSVRTSSNVELTGVVPRSTVPEHLEWADVFVLPTLCEGSATVCYEALAAGLPVITTPHAGSVIRDGLDGYIVPIRDASAISVRLELIASDPDLHEALSENASARAAEFTVSRYAERLLSAIPATRKPLAKAC
jgi:glycosyltransferase involved in cell wall biosynthesis